jgi:hypothetical protein
MITQTFPISSTRIRSGETASSQQAWQEMGATGRDVRHASDFRGSVAGASVRTAISSQSDSPGPAVCATPSLEQLHRNAVPSSCRTKLLLPQWRWTSRCRRAVWRHGESLIHDSTDKEFGKFSILSKAQAAQWLEYGLNDRSSITGVDMDFSLSQPVQTDSGAHPALIQ